MGLIERVQALQEDGVPGDTDVCATLAEIEEAFAIVREAGYEAGWDDGWKEEKS
jgi:hypothetical protein